MYKEFSKSAGDTWDDISRRAYGTPEKGGDIAKMNNNIEEGKVLVLEEAETNSDDVEITGEIYLRHGEVNYNDFSECSLFDGMEAIKGASFVFNQTDIDYNFSFCDSVTVCDEEGLFLKGRIANIKPCLTDFANWVQIEVKSHAGVLAETNMPNPFEFASLSVRGVLEQVAGYYNQKISFSGEAELDEVFTNEIGTSFTAEKSETVWQFMRRICRSRGLLLTDTGDGLFIGRYKPETQEKLNLIEGACLGVKDIRGEFLTVGLARYYELNSQYPSTDTATAQIPFPVPITKRIDSNDFNSLNLLSTAQMFACKQIGEHFKIYALLSENIRKKSGDFVVVKFPKIKIQNETDFVIESIERRHPDKTFLILTLPCAYTYEIPETLILNGYPVEFYQQKESHFEIAPLENRSGATCFISIHCNSFSSKEANGVEVFYCKGSQKGKKLAEITQNELVKATGLRDRKIKEREDLTVLNRTKAPAILVELGFISNKDDLYSLVLQPEIFANAIWEAIKRFNSEKLI